MRAAWCVAAAIVSVCMARGISRGQGLDQASGGWYPDQSIDQESPAPPTRRPLRPIPGYPQGGALPFGGTYSGAPGTYPQQPDGGYPTSRTYYDYSPTAPRPDSYGRMRSGGLDIDRRGDQIGADWYRNMPAPNYDSRGRRY